MRTRRLLVGLAWAALLAGCGKKAPPSGGPPDLEPPRLIAVTPDSGAARVSRGVQPTLSFSEGMEPRSSGDAIALAPPVEIRRLRWSRRNVTVVFAESLAAGQVYTLLVGLGARDRHGNPIAESRSVVFTTGDSFPPGQIEGHLDARGFTASSASLWCYDEGRGHEPDSTGRDFDAIGLVDGEGAFRVPGLRAPARYRLWTFADLNNNRSFEPSTDLLVPVDTSIALSAEAPVARDLRLRVVNPRAPARVQGAVLDSLAEREGNLVVMAVADSDSTQRVLANVSEEGKFDLQLVAGRWSLRAFRDVDKNRVWDRARESASRRIELLAEPAGETADLVLELRPPSESGP